MIHHVVNEEGSNAKKKNYKENGINHYDKEN
jgi:hypothetical protein